MSEIERGGGVKGYYRESVLLSEMKKAGVKMQYYSFVFPKGLLR
jgi:hypothetical protein